MHWDEAESAGNLRLLQSLSFPRLFVCSGNHSVVMIFPDGCRCAVGRESVEGILASLNEVMASMSRIRDLPQLVF